MVTMESTEHLESLENLNGNYHMICNCATTCEDALCRDTFFKICINGGQDCIRKPDELGNETQVDLY